MKKLLIAGALLASSGFANAGLSFSQGSLATRTEISELAGLPTFGIGTPLALGSLATDQAGTITFTYLGQHSRILNSFELQAGGQHFALAESDAVGTSISAGIDAAGPIDFRFAEDGGTTRFAQNGGRWTPNTSIGLLGKDLSVDGRNYAYVLGYNDSVGSARYGNWADFVVGVNFAPTSPVPEPGLYGMLLTGLGVLSWTATRKRRR